MVTVLVAVMNRNPAVIIILYKYMQLSVSCYAELFVLYDLIINSIIFSNGHQLNIKQVIIYEFPLKRKLILCTLK